MLDRDRLAGYRAEMSITSDEIGSQPELWRQAADLAPGLAGILPRPGLDVCVIGCGTSLYMGQAWAALREARGHGRTDAFPASELPPGRAYDVVVALSRSGTTTEVAHALARTDGARTVAITAAGGTPVADAADDVVLLDFADEASVVQTRFATTALTLLRAHAGVDVAAAAADADRALQLPLPVEPGAADRWAFLGRGWTVGLASEAALKLREAAQAWTEAYPVFEYRHGPISIAGPGAVVWFLGPPADSVRDGVVAAGGTPVAPDLDPLASLVLAQRTAVALAEAAGLDPDNPRNLTRSVVLTSSEVPQ
jgi:fructoselysine-6-P-deglycase FrlB-like protein